MLWVPDMINHVDMIVLLLMPYCFEVHPAVFQTLKFLLIGFIALRCASDYTGIESLLRSYRTNLDSLSKPHCLYWACGLSKGDHFWQRVCSKTPKECRYLAPSLGWGKSSA